MEMKINYVQEVNIKQPIKVELKDGKQYYTRKIVVKTTKGFEDIILNSYDKEIIIIEPSKTTTKTTTKTK